MSVDPGTAIAVASIVLDAAKELYQYYRAWNECEDDVRQIRKQLLWLYQTSLAVQDLLRRPSLCELEQGRLESALQNWRENASDLAEILAKTKIGYPGPSTALAKVRAAGRKSVYPFRKSTVQAIAEHVESWQEALHLTLSMLHLEATAESLEALSRIDFQITNGLRNIEDTFEQFRVSHEAATTSTIAAVNARASETQAALDLNLAESMDINDKITSHHNSFQSWVKAQQSSRHTKNLINTLNPGDIYRRRDEITGAHASTFRWLFDDPDSGFVEWLRKDNGIFWISGKAGSGKSTLMKYISDEPRTLNLLKEWTGGARLCTSEHYFWYAGTDLQKSSEGLLRSLLYQILQNDASCLASITRSRLVTHDSIARQRSIKDLLAGLEDITKTPDRKFFFLIDGLDECYPSDRQQDLIDTLSRISASPNVKFVVSSRPWVIFEQAFGQRRQKLYLEQLTRADIRIYVSDALAGSSQEPFASAFRAKRDLESIMSTGVDDQARRLVDEVTSKSEGVFLWVYLVVRGLSERLRARQPITALQLFVDQFPRSLEDYYKSILDRIHETWQTDGAIALKIMMMIVNEAPQTRKIILLSFWMLSQQTPAFFDDPDFALNAPFGRCKTITPKKLADDVRDYLDACCKDFCTVSMRPELQQNERHDFDILFDVNFLHRTVYDFLCLEDMYQLINKRCPPHFKDGQTLPHLVLMCSKSLPIGCTTVSPIHARQILEEIAKALSRQDFHDSIQRTNNVPRMADLVAEEFGKVALYHLRMLESENPDPEGLSPLTYVILRLKERNIKELAAQIEAESAAHYKSYPTA